MREGENRLERAPRLSFLAKAALTRARSGAWLLRGSARPPPEGIRILFYHRVSDDRDDLAVRPRRFREQMEALAAEGFRVVDVAEAAALLRRGETVGRTIALSFDDGYLDVAEQALPVLERHGFRASVFLVTGALDGEVEFTWYRRRPPLLGWDDVLRLDGGSPLRFEAHTVTHPSLPGLGDERAREEIAGSKAALEARLGRTVEAFCYPAGLFGARDRRLAAEAGFAAAVTCEPGVNVPATDPFALHRIPVERRDRLVDFRAKVGGAHDEALPLRGLYRRLRY